MTPPSSELLLFALTPQRSHMTFANDGSFMEMMLKMQQQQQPQKPSGPAPEFGDDPEAFEICFSPNRS